MYLCATLRDLFLAKLCLKPTRHDVSEQIRDSNFKAAGLYLTIKLDINFKILAYEDI